MKNEVCECRWQLRSQVECLAERETTLAMVLKLINKTPEDDVGTSKRVEVHCYLFHSHIYFIKLYGIPIIASFIVK